MKDLISELREIVGGESLTEAVISDVFVDEMQPIAKAIALADKNIQKKVEEFTENVFRIVKSFGIKEYKLDFYGKSISIGTGGKGFGLHFRPQFHLWFFYDEGADADKAAAILRKAYKAKFINPRVETGAHLDSKHKYYIAVNPEEMDIAVPDLK